MGIALFHLLPESCEGFEHYFAKEGNTESSFKELPNAYFIAFLCYSLVLFVEKVAFDSHSLIEHDGGEHGHGHGHGHDEHDHKNELKAPLKPQELKSDHHAHNHDEKDDDSDEDEEAIKNVVSSRGKFASFMQQRNILKSGGSMVNPDKALLKASHILSKKYEVDEMNSLLVNPQKTDIAEKEKTGKESHESHVQGAGEEFVPKSNITPYLLLVALSFHGLFEGIALGLQKGNKETLFLFIAIISHKWAEAFTLGISFSKAQTDKVTFVRLILLFSFFTPIGIIIGMFLASSNELVEAIFLALSTGTFLYVSASEVIVEEFAVTKYKYQKFIMYLLGGILIAGLAVIEKMGEGGHSH